jgi:hypothetical protein
MEPWQLMCPHLCRDMTVWVVHNSATRLPISGPVIGWRLNHRQEPPLTAINNDASPILSLKQNYVRSTWGWHRMRRPASETPVGSSAWILTCLKTLLNCIGYIRSNGTMICERWIENDMATVYLRLSYVTVITFVWLNKTVQILQSVYEIWDSYGGEDVDVGLVDCNSVNTYR